LGNKGYFFVEVGIFFVEVDWTGWSRLGWSGL